MSNKNKKIKIEYPDGRCECLSVVADTYRNAIQYMGLEEVRALNIMRNSINIVSTPEEIQKSSGKEETAAINRMDPTTKLCICTQFETEVKYNILNEVNDCLHKNLRISLVDPDEEDTTIYVLPTMATISYARYAVSTSRKPMESEKMPNPT